MGRSNASHLPGSARITSAAATPTPGISSSLATASAKGAICSSVRASTAAMSAVNWSTRDSI
ncbi:MAG: hypothetical protein WCG47_07660, partial [Dermatophilaceae bacterium]